MITFSVINKNKGAQIMCDPDTLSLIRENFSIANPSYRRGSPHYTPTRIYSITPQGKFDVGLYGEIISFLNLNHFQFEENAEITRNFNPHLTNSSVLQFESKVYRPYQNESIHKALKQGRGVTVIPTAGGKTLIMAGLIKSLYPNFDPDSVKVLVLVPSIQLVEQTASDFLEYGLTKISKWSGDNKPDLNCRVIVAGTQILLSKNTDLSFLSEIDIFLMDEVHGAKRGNRINDILKFINTPFKFGFTGTMPSSKIDCWNIIGKFGPITFEQKTSTLKEQSYVSNFKIIILKIKHHLLPDINLDLTRPAEAYQSEMEFLLSNQRRNEIITNLAIKLNENTLIMVDRIEHGHLLYNILTEKKQTTLSEERPIYFIQGSTEMEDREKIRSLMDHRRDVIVIAISKIFSTGINIPNLHNIIFASIGKAKIKIMQSIGRVLRLHHTKNLATIFDIADNTKYGKKHVEERKKMYNLEKYEYTEKEIS